MNGWTRRISAVSTRSALLIILALAAPGALAGQATATAAGRILRMTGTDSVPVGGMNVVLHSIASGEQGPVDSIRTSADGRFRFRFRADTAAVYLLSARHDGIAYFSLPLHPLDDAADTLVTIIVSDTSSTAPIVVASRHIVFRSPDADGSRQALDLIVLQNPGTVTRVAPDTLSASWSITLPAGVAAATPGDNDFSPDAIAIRNDSVLVSAPIAPGEKQVAVQYVVPPELSPLRVSIPEAYGSLTVLAEESGLEVEGAGLAPADTQVIAGTAFHRWMGSPEPGGEVSITFPSGSGGTGAPAWVLPALVLLVGAGLAVAIVRVRSPRGGIRDAPTPENLVEALARLDARYQGRRGEIPPAEWDRYQTERAGLRRELDQQLAGPGPPT